MMVLLFDGKMSASEVYLVCDRRSDSDTDARSK